MEWRLFGDIAELAGTRRVSIELDASSTLGEAIDALLEHHPELEDRLFDGDELADHVTLLRNGENVMIENEGFATKLAEDDELALFPPVSGG